MRNKRNSPAENYVAASIGFIGSRLFLALTITLFSLESAWLAIVSRFPMAFDEGYHYNLIKFFSYHLNPVITHQTAYSYRFGAIIQDPSFLYHYLMSFPYRLIDLFSHSPQVQVIFLRLISVALAVASLVIFKKILRLIKLSPALSNLVVLAFALTPLSVVLSAQISYDNLFILMVALCVYQALLFLKSLELKKPDTRRLILVVCLGMFTSLVKYAFLPILLAISLVLAFKLIMYRRRNGDNLAQQLSKNFKSIGKASKITLVTAALAGALLFTRSYGVNLVRYHTPVPSCDQVLNIDSCRHNYSWKANYEKQQYVSSHRVSINANLLQYSGNWSLWASYYLFGAVVPLQGVYEVSSFFYSAMLILFIVAAGSSVVYFRRIMRSHDGIGLLLAISALYMATLWIDSYIGYSKTGVPAFVDGRYWLPVIIFLYAWLALGIKYLIGSQRFSDIIKLSLAIFIIVLFITVGGCVPNAKKVIPNYGRLGPSNQFELQSSASG